jgi:hypothetical protein
MNIDVNTAAIPDGVDRRGFMTRNALVGAMTVISGRSGPSPVLSLVLC